MQQNSQRPLAIRIVVVIVGVLLLLLGVLGWLLPLMPGWVLVIGGLATLAGEFAWARRLLDGARARLNRMTRRLPRRDA